MSHSSLTQGKPDRKVSNGAIPTAQKFFKYAQDEKLTKKVLTHRKAPPCMLGKRFRSSDIACWNNWKPILIPITCASQADGWQFDVCLGLNIFVCKPFTCPRVPILCFLAQRDFFFYFTKRSLFSSFNFQKGICQA